VNTEYFLTEELNMVGDITILGNLTIWSNQGNVLGPTSATDNALARYDETSGKYIQDGKTIEDDSGNLTLGGTLTTITGTSALAPINIPESGTQKATPIDGDIQYVGGHLFFYNKKQLAISLGNGVKTTNTTVTNTVTETTLHSFTISANQLHIDQKIKVFLSGSVTTASASDDYILKAYLGATLLHTLSRVGGNVTDVGWDIYFDATTRAVGVSGTMIDHFKLTEETVSISSADLTLHTIDTTVSNTIEVKVTWANAKAGNSITATQGHIEYIH
jgi:hypothetical protein